MTDLVVLDPGHGGDEPCGISTPAGVTSGAGLREKDLTLALAFRIRDALAARGTPALLTRDGDENPSLRERAFVSRGEDACAFVSVHFNEGEAGARGCEVWVHDRSGPRSERLAESVRGALEPVVGAAAPEALRGPMAVLDPAMHPTGCAACLVEVDYLSNPSAEARLRDPGFLDALSAAVARGIAEGTASERPARLSVRASRDHFDVWQEVPLVQQLTGMSCWAAAAAMLIGWRDCIDIDAEEVAAGVGRWEAYRDGLVPGDVQTCADAWGLTLERPRRYTVHTLRALLVRNGPLWVGEATPGLHVVVIAGMSGDGTPDGTHVRIADPWPVGKGERYTITFAELARNLDAASDISGIPAQVLHTRGRGGPRRIYSEHREIEASFGSRQPDVALAQRRELAFAAAAEQSRREQGMPARREDVETLQHLVLPRRSEACASGPSASRRRSRDSVR